MNSQPGDICPNTASTVLVVEDNPQAAKLLSLYIRQAGYGVVVAGSGSEALRLAKRCHPQAITLDLLLPDQDGWEVLTALKHSPSTRDIPVVIISVLDRQSLGYELGAADYLVKPIERGALIHALKRSLGRDKPTFRRVLVMHNNPEELKILTLLMSEHNYEVFEAMSPEEAVWLARRMQPDLVVTGLLAGDVDWAELVESLKVTPETAQIPILALTAKPYAGTDTAYEAVRFVLIRGRDIEQPLLSAITLLFADDAPAEGKE